MAETIVHHAAGLVTVVHRPDLGAVHLQWINEYDPGTRVRDAVLTALEFVHSAGIRHWIVDVGASRSALSDADYAWVSSSDFRDRIVASPLRKFVLIPPLPETGQDASWVADWEASTLMAFGDTVAARVCPDMDAAVAFLTG